MQLEKRDKKKRLLSDCKLNLELSGKYERSVLKWFDHIKRLTEEHFAEQLYEERLAVKRSKMSLDDEIQKNR